MPKRRKIIKKKRKQAGFERPYYLRYLFIFAGFLVILTAIVAPTKEFFGSKVVKATPPLVHSSNLLAQAGESLLPTSIPLPSPTPTAAPTATPVPVGFCLTVPVLMYHHIQPMDEAKAAGHAQLTVDPSFFEKQMQYINSAGYRSISAEELVNSLISHQNPGKVVVVTIDDGYLDNYTHAYDIAKRYSIKLNFMIATGLLGNGDYMNWDQLKEMVNNGMYAYDHTWSHFGLPGGDINKMTSEIMTAKKQLEDQLGKPQRIFTYPYGNYDGRAIEILRQNGFLGAFSTIQSKLQCDGYIMTLHRTRVGNSPLSAYGL